MVRPTYALFPATICFISHWVCDLNHKMALSARLCFQEIVRSAQSPDGGTANTGLYKAGRIGPTRGIALWGPMFSVRLCSSRYP